ncbi:hypothetical protein K505DRAFT_416828 [Melanomma pulvis-pyrius CBS 109.77]|uniref:Uncharacterized protein n=1 Tax=Melanomma pulvis-pyrius CBS 109.77 TaxID=1314802 RepID=A0A6A6XF13_9PLEO|nr:hypothetical protein K505DRAFT_416828 [Melanomma pulvis-pyrius CBS 109.77]
MCNSTSPRRQHASAEDVTVEILLLNSTFGKREWSKRVPLEELMRVARWSESGGTSARTLPSTASARQEQPGRRSGPMRPGPTEVRPLAKQPNLVDSLGRLQTCPSRFAFSRLCQRSAGEPSRGVVEGVALCSAADHTRTMQLHSAVSKPLSPCPTRAETFKTRRRGS